MVNKAPEIIVTGDVNLNLLFWQKEATIDNNLNYKLYPNVSRRYEEGGALLLSKLVSLATELDVSSPSLKDENLSSVENILVSVLQLNKFTADDSQNKNKVYRVEEFSGYYIEGSEEPRAFSLVNDNEDAKIVVLDDNNNGFNSNEDVWPLAIKESDKTPTILYKTNKIDFNNKLWMHIEKKHLKNTVVIINAEDLRAKGVNISKGLSWEKTALDFVWQMKNNPRLKHLSECTNLIIPFGLEGVIYYHKELNAESKLYFLTDQFEGGFIKEDSGKMYGLTSCFVAGLVKAIVNNQNEEELPDLIDEGIRLGMVSAQRYFINGFGSDIENYKYSNESLFKYNENDFSEYIQDVKIKDSSNPNCQSCWYIIKDKSSTNLEEIAYEIVKKGENSALKYIPIAKFRNLKTVDRTEIEAYRSIKNLIAEYISKENTVRPLSIAVFGTPGSGKSFGVTEVAASIAPNLIEKIDFNLSQFQSINDLIAAFHKVRDIALNGKLPLVFFDEFDSSFGESLGWLKYFLAPMQDGIFREGDSLHPIGKAIFVFAGGTSSTYESFCGEDIKDKDKIELFEKSFKNAKGPDFVSRLRGYVNILGPNQTDKDWDQLFVIRRAMLLRSLLVRKTPYLINDNGEAQVDNGIIRALLKVSKFKHESRSMEAILEMSMLSGVKKWEQSYLPSQNQLKLHVDEQEFYHYMMFDEFFSEKTNNLSEYILNRYKKMYLENGEINIDSDDMMLHNYIQKWIIEQIKNIPQILHKDNYELNSIKDNPKVMKFTEHDLESLAKYQHKIWMKKRKKEGWKYGKEANFKKLIHPSITGWNNLNDNIKNVIKKYIELWPEALVENNLRIEKSDYSCYCEQNDLQ
ncbi:RyR domain-containing protein [Terrisporobacter sp.]